MKRTWC